MHFLFNLGRYWIIDKVLHEISERDINLQSLANDFEGNNVKFECVKHMYLETIFVINMSGTLQVETLQNIYFDNSEWIDKSEKDYSIITKECIILFY